MITAGTVQRRDVITVGGQDMRVRDLVRLPGGAKRLVFDSGETLTLHPGTILAAVRTLPASSRPTARHRSVPRRAPVPGPAERRRL